MTIHTLAIVLLTPVLGCVSQDANTPSQGPSHGGKGDNGSDTGSGSGSASSVIVECSLEYVAYTPAYSTAPLASLNQSLATIAGPMGATASGDGYTLAVIRNHTATDVPFEVDLLGQNALLAYGLVPEPAPAGNFFIELGAPIPTHHVDTTDYTALRAYCLATTSGS